MQEQSKRYMPEEIISDVTGATVKNFKLEKVGRDRFGNRLFTSTNLAYLDRAGDKVIAGILISLEGQRFIKENPAILKDIDHGLFLLDPQGNGEVNNFKTIDLKGKGTLKFQTRGAQSNVFILTMTNGKKYVIKSKISKDQIAIVGERIYQPYINEMLQTQVMAVDLKDELTRLRIEMQEFLFASGQVSCTRYEENAEQLRFLDENEIYRLRSAVEGFIIEKQDEKDSLWENMKIDLPENRMALGLTLLRNFRTRSDKTLVWIDPFFIKCNSLT